MNMVALTKGKSNMYIIKVAQIQSQLLIKLYNWYMNISVYYPNQYISYIYNCYDGPSIAFQSCSFRINGF